MDVVSPTWRNHCDTRNIGNARNPVSAWQLAPPWHGGGAPIAAAGTGAQGALERGEELVALHAAHRAAQSAKRSPARRER